MTQFPQTSGGPPDPPAAVAATSAAESRAARGRFGPRGHGSEAGAWLLLFACLVPAAIGLTVFINLPDAVDAVEVRTLATSSETWRWLRDLPPAARRIAQIAPRFSGEPAWSAAPGNGALHAIAFTAGAADGADPGRTIACARIVSAVLMLLTIASVYWSAFSLGGRGAACLAALVGTSFPLLLYEGRTATDLPAGLAFSQLTIAAALWAVRPLRPTAAPTRVGLGWTMCGLALGAAVLTAGPDYAVIALLPLIMILLLCPQRINHFVGLAAALCIAGLLLAPWVVAALENDPQAWRDWLARVSPRIDDPAAFGRRAGIRALFLVGATAPWTIWLLGAALLPFSASSAGSRRRLFLGWVWFGSAAAWAIVGPYPTDYRCAAAALPPAAVMAGQFFRQLSDLSAEGRHARIWRVLRWPHLVMMIVLSAAIPSLLLLQGELVRRGHLQGELSDPMNSPFWVGLGVVLLLIAATAGHSAIRQYPGRSTVYWTLWSIIGFALLVNPVVRGPFYRQPVKADARTLAGLAGGADVPRSGPEAPADAALALYAGVTIRPYDANAADGSPALLITAAGADGPPGYTEAAHLATAARRVWRRGDDAIDGPAVDTMPPALRRSPGDQR